MNPYDRHQQTTTRFAMSVRNVNAIEPGSLHHLDGTLVAPGRCAGRGTAG